MLKWLLILIGVVALCSGLIEKKLRDWNVFESSIASAMPELKSSVGQALSHLEGTYPDEKARAAIGMMLKLDPDTYAGDPWKNPDVQDFPYPETNKLLNLFSNALKNCHLEQFYTSYHEHADPLK